MTEASAYVLESIQEKLESAHNFLISYLRKSSRAISARSDLENYEKTLGETHEALEKTVNDYPDDEEARKISDRFSSFYSKRHKASVRDQKEIISNLLADFKSMVHWRKMETAHGRTLGFSDFRSLRGESKKR